MAIEIRRGELTVRFDDQDRVSEAFIVDRQTIVDDGSGARSRPEDLPPRRVAAAELADLLGGDVAGLLEQLEDLRAERDELADALELMAQRAVAAERKLNQAAAVLGALAPAPAATEPAERG